ncbi:hypothetical protein HN011_004790 [Eciton burchellii]|nr:hypothetical protein HN011_004790 [Eciton burchellii]
MQVRDDRHDFFPSMWVTRVMRSLTRATYPRLNDESRLWGGGSQRWVHIGVSIGSWRVPAAWPGALAKLGYHPTIYTLATRERIRATFAPPASAFAALLFIASPSYLRVRALRYPPPM